LTNFAIVSGMRATRFSPGERSFGTAIFIWHRSEQDAHLSSLANFFE
jgi:hypothetical protein